MDQRTELRRKAQQQRNNRCGDKSQRGVNPCYRHDANIFGIGSYAAAANAARKHGRQTITNKCPTHVRIEAAPGHASHRF